MWGWVEEIEQILKILTLRTKVQISSLQYTRALLLFREKLNYSIRPLGIGYIPFVPYRKLQIIIINKTDGYNANNRSILSTIKGSVWHSME
jgi:hypothetical protein